MRRKSVQTEKKIEKVKYVLVRFLIETNFKYSSCNLQHSTYRESKSFFNITHFAYKYLISQ